MRAALARAETSPATQAAHAVLLVSAAATGHPRYPEFERRMGPEGARRLLIESGIGVLSDRFAQDNPATRPSETTLADAHIKTFNALQSLFHAHGVDRTAESLGALTAKVFGRMDKGQQVRVAAGDAGTVAAVVSSVLHGSPQALAKRQSELAEPDGAARHRGHRGRLHGALGHGAFARDRFGHIQHGGGEQRSASGNGGGERYGALPGNNGITYGAERYSFAQMAQYASAQGVPWAVHSPELMRLGPAAIKTIADAGIKQPTYKALTNEAKFKAKDVVNLAHLAKDTGQNATDLSNDTVKTFKKVEPTERGRQQLGGIFGDYLEERKANQAKAATRLKTRVHERYKAAPAKERELQPLMRRYGVVAAADAKATQRAGTHVAAADNKTAKADAKGQDLAALLETPSSGAAKPSATPAAPPSRSAQLQPPKSTKPAPSPTGVG